MVMELIGKVQEVPARAHVHGGQDISERHSTQGLSFKGVSSTPWCGLEPPSPHQRGPEHSISKVVQDGNFVCCPKVGLASGVPTVLEGAGARRQCQGPRRPRHAKHSSTKQLWGGSCFCHVRVQLGNGWWRRAWSKRITRNSGLGRRNACGQKSHLQGGARGWLGTSRAAEVEVHMASVSLRKIPGTKAVTTAQMLQTSLAGVACKAGQVGAARTMRMVSSQSCEPGRGSVVSQSGVAYRRRIVGNTGRAWETMVSRGAMRKQLPLALRESWGLRQCPGKCIIVL